MSKNVKLTQNLIEEIDEAFDVKFASASVIGEANVWYVSTDYGFGPTYRVTKDAQGTVLNVHTVLKVREYDLEPQGFKFRFTNNRTLRVRDVDERTPGQWTGKVLGTVFQADRVPTPAEVQALSLFDEEIELERLQMQAAEQDGVDREIRRIVAYIAAEGPMSIKMVVGFAADAAVEQGLMEELSTDPDIQAEELKAFRKKYVR